LKVESLKETRYGRFVVTTTSDSRYLLDLNASTMRRLPALDMAVDRSLRRDSEVIDVIALRCYVGRPMVLIVDLHIPGTLFTRRRTTDVRSIEVLAGGGNDLVALLG
jgi:hypothetical protein